MLCVQPWMLKAVAERTVLPNTLQFHRSLEQMRQNVVFFSHFIGFESVCLTPNEFTEECFPHLKRYSRSITGSPPLTRSSAEQRGT